MRKSDVLRAETYRARQSENETKESARAFFKILEVLVARAGGFVEVTAAEMEEHLSVGYTVSFQGDEDAVRIGLVAPEVDHED